MSLSARFTVQDVIRTWEGEQRFPRRHAALRRGQGRSTLEWKRRRDDDDVPLCLEGSEGAEFTGPMPRGGELVFSKRRYNAFQDTGLDIALRGEDIDTLVMAGLTTDCCIDSSVRAAFERDYHVYVVGDATACYQPGLHQATLEALALNCATILSVDDVISAWK